MISSDAKVAERLQRIEINDNRRCLGSGLLPSHGRAWTLEHRSGRNVLVSAFSVELMDEAFRQGGIPAGAIGSQMDGVPSAVQAKSRISPGPIAIDTQVAPPEYSAPGTDRDEGTSTMRVRNVLAAAAAVLMLAAGPAKAEEEKVLNVYNWSDYIAPDTLEKFTRETGIKVNYDVYDDNSILEAKLMAGKTGYDVVFPSALPFLAQQIKAGIYQPLDRARIPNWNKLSASAMKSMEAADPGNLYGAPYMIAATGIGYNVTKVAKAAPDAPVDSWAMLFDPKVVNQLKSCGVTLLDTPTEVFPAALAYLGRTPTSQETADLDAAADATMKIRPALRYIHSSKYISDLANGEICVAHGYVGDLVQARTRAEKAKNRNKIAIVIPKEGAEVNIDVMAIPKDAPHPDNAHKFIDFILRPEIIAAITNETGYANAVTEADALVAPEVKSDPAIYPPAEVTAKLFTLPVADKTFERLRTRAWTRIKTRY